MNYARVNVVVGARNTGKTTWVKKCVNAYMLGSNAENPRRTLIIDTYASASYEDYEIIKPSQLLAWKKGIKRIIVPAYELDSVLQLLIDNEINNIFLVVEDSQKYFEDRISDVQKIWLADVKNKGRETMFVFHFFTNIPKRLFPMINGIVIKKTSDTKADVKQRSANADVLSAYELVNASKNPYEQKYVKINE